MKTTSVILALGSAMSIVACSAGDVSVPEGMRVAQLRGEVVTKDRPAADAFSNLATLVAEGRHAKAGLGVYSLKAPSALAGRVAARAADLGLSTKAGIVSKAAAHVAGVQNGSWTLTVNEYSDGEEYVDTERNHAGASVPESALPSDQDFVTAALGHAKKALAATVGRNSLYPFRIRKYFNAHSSEQGTVVDGVYQIAVAFNTTIDGLPVIGTGGKIAVDMTIDKSVIRHEHAVREKGDLIHVITGNKDLVAPQTAETAVNSRLDSRGVDRSKFRVTRREFGYLAQARSRIQTVLVPHYVFFFEPLPGTMSKVLVEIEPATNDPQVLDLIAMDNKADGARKAATMAVPDTGIRK